MRLFIFAALVFFGWNGIADLNCPQELPKDLCDFDIKVYTATNFKNTNQVRALFTELKNLMMAHVNDAGLVQEHLLDLATQMVEESYAQRAPKKILALADGQPLLLSMLPRLKKWEARHGQIIPLDWRLPAGISIGIAALGHFYDASTDHAHYAVSFFATLDRPLEIEQFKISRYPGQPLIDKQSGIGSWHEGRLAHMSKPFFNAGSSAQATPLSDGLYLLTIKVKGQKSVEGWFFLRGTATTHPAVAHPVVNESLATPQPTFSFADFKTNYLLSSDSRKLRASVVHEGEQENIWRVGVIHPKNQNSMTLGHEAHQYGAVEIPPGAYRLSLAFEERSFFGDITIGRDTVTTVPFKIIK